MIVRNVSKIQFEAVTGHNGKGKIQFSRPFDSSDFESPWHFVDFVILPPSTSIGIHQHGANEEMYFIVEGTAVMTVNGSDCEVTKGDLILNKPGWSHGLRNEGEANVEVLVVEVGLK